MAGTGIRTVAVAALIVGMAGAGLAGQAFPGAQGPKDLAPHTPVPGSYRTAGLWDKPNEHCMTRCRVFVQKDCFTKTRQKQPYADPASIQSACEDKYSICLYDCMCDTCDEDQIVIKEP